MEYPGSPEHREIVILFHSGFAQHSRSRIDTPDFRSRITLRCAQRKAKGDEEIQFHSIAVCVLRQPFKQAKAPREVTDRFAVGIPSLTYFGGLKIQRNSASGQRRTLIMAGQLRADRVRV